MEATMEKQLFWLQGDQNVHPILRGRRNADAVVVGGGFAGLTIALWLCRAGLRVVLLEAETLGSGASSRCLGRVSLLGGVRYARLEQLHGREISAAYGLSQQNAFVTLRDLATQPQAGCGWLEADDHLTGLATEEEKMFEEVQAMERAGVAAQLGKATQSPMPADCAIHVKDMALLHPMRYLQWLVREGERLGLKIFEHSRVISMETNMAGTQRGSVLAPYIIVATGYPVVNIPGWYFLRLIQKQSWLIPLNSEAQFSGTYGDLGQSYFIRRLGKGMLMQLNGSRVGEKTGVDPLAQYRQEYAPYLNGAQPVQAYGGIDTYSADGLPFIGPYGKRTPNMFVACGFGGRGLIGSMLAAQSISARILGLNNEGDAIYSGQRKGDGFTGQQVKAGLSIGGRYAGNLFRFHAPYCSHMGCKLRYRPDQRLWECPCHGSRFDDIGHVKNAPATRDAVIRYRRRG